MPQANRFQLELFEMDVQIFDFRLEKVKKENTIKNHGIGQRVEVRKGGELKGRWDRAALTQGASWGQWPYFKFWVRDCRRATEATDTGASARTHLSSFKAGFRNTAPRSPAAFPKASCGYCCRRATLCITAYDIPPRVQLWLGATSGVSCYI